MQSPLTPSGKRDPLHKIPTRHIVLFITTSVVVQVSVQVSQLSCPLVAMADAQAQAAGTPCADAPWQDGPKVQAAIEELLKDVNRETVTLRKFRRQVASHLGLGKKGLEGKADEVNVLIKEAIAQQSQTAETASERMAKVIEALGEENRKAKHMIYLATLSHVLPEALARSRAAWQEAPAH